MKQDGSFQVSQPELDARDPQDYYSYNYNQPDLSIESTDTELSDQFVVETDVDPYDEVFFGTGNGLSEYSNGLEDSQPDPPSYYNVVRL